MEEAKSTDLTKEEPAGPGERADLPLPVTHQKHSASVRALGLGLWSSSQEPAHSAGALATAALRLSLAGFVDLVGFGLLGRLLMVPPMAVFVAAVVGFLVLVGGAGFAITGRHSRSGGPTGDPRLWPEPADSISCQSINAVMAELIQDRSCATRMSSRWPSATSQKDV